MVAIATSRTNTKAKEASIGEIIAKNLQYLAKKSGLTEADISRQIDCSPQTLNRMFRGVSPDPKISIVRKLASLFEVPIAYLFSENALNDLEHYKMLPLLEWEELSEISHFSTLIANNADRHWQPVDLSVSSDAFLLRSTKSMAPRFPYGTIFVIEPHIQPADGDIVIVHFRENNIFSARELIIDAPQWKLNHITDNSPPLLYESSEQKIIGVVLEKRFFQGR